MEKKIEKLIKLKSHNTEDVFKAGVMEGLNLAKGELRGIMEHMVGDETEKDIVELREAFIKNMEGIMQEIIEEVKKSIVVDGDVVVN